MAAPTTEYRYSGGDLILGPTNTIPPSYGGTRLGTVHDCVLVAEYIIDPVLGEEYGNEDVERIVRRIEWLARFRIMNWDADAVQQLPALIGAAGTALSRLTYPQAGQGPGDTLADKNRVLAYAPKDVDNQGPGWKMFNAAIVVINELRFDGGEPIVLELEARAQRDGSGNVIRIGAITEIL